MVEQTQGSATATRKVTLRALPIGEGIAVGALAERMRVEPVQVIKQLMRVGVFASMNQAIDFEVASTGARVFGFAARKIEEATGTAAGAVAGAAVGAAAGAAAGLRLGLLHKKYMDRIHT